MKPSKIFSVLAALVLISATPSTRAGLHIWTGAGATTLWSNPQNWVSLNPPSAVEAAPVQILFPTPAHPASLSTNDISGLQVDLISITGSHYSIGSAGFRPIALKGGLSFVNAGSFNVFDIRLQLTGANTISSEAGADVTITSTVAGSGGFTTAGAGQVIFAGGGLGNAFIGPLWARASGTYLNKAAGGAVTSALIVGSSGAAAPNWLTCLSDGQIGRGATVTVFPNGLLDLQGHTNTIHGLVLNGGAVFSGFHLSTGLLELNGDVMQPSTNVSGAAVHGNVSLGSATRVFDVETNHLGVYANLSGGVGAGLTKTGSGGLSLYGTNTYSGPTTVLAGSVYLYGPTKSSAFTVNAAGTLRLLADAGPLIANGGQIEIGFYYASVQCAGLEMDGAGRLEMNEDGLIPGIDADRLVVNGPIILNNGALKLALGFAPAMGQSLTLIDHVSHDAVVGHFNDLPEGGRLTNSVDHSVYVITYRGGDGNDVTLTRVPLVVPPPTIIGLTTQANGSKTLSAIGTIGVPYNVLATDSLTPPSPWSVIGSVVAGVQAKIQFIDPDAPKHPVRFYRLVAP